MIKPYSSLLALGVVLGSALGCAAEDTDKAGLIVSIQTDFSVPKDIDQVRLEVSAKGDVRFGSTLRIGEGELLLPATLVVLPAESGPGNVTVRVISYQANGEARTLRRVDTQVPDSREALLRMPVEWLCDGQVEAVTAGSETSSCPTGQSCVAGRCASDKVDASTLPDYADSDVYGGGTADGSGRCFDTTACFAKRNAVGDALDLESCTAPASELRGAQLGTLNLAVALGPGGDGICEEGDAGECFIPLDQDDVTGWRLEGDTVHFPPALCEKLELPSAPELVQSDSCDTKTARTPTCGPWSITSEPAP